MEIIEKSAIKAWKRALKMTKSNGKDFIDDNKRVCRQVIDLVIHVRDTENITAPIELLKTKTTFIYPELEELKKNILTKEPAPYYYSYGNRIFNHEGRDQINDFIIPLLKTNPHSRRAVIVIWNAKKDSSLNRKEIPGHVMMDFKVIDNKINITSYIRSNDLFFGWPANVYQMNILQKFVAEALGMDCGSIITISGSAHIFRDQLKEISYLLNSNIVRR